MGKGAAGSDGGLLPVHLQQQQSQGQLQRLAFVGFLTLLLTVNLMYFVKTHTRIESLSASAGRAVKPAASGHLGASLTPVTWALCVLCAAADSDCQRQLRLPGSFSTSSSNQLSAASVTSSTAGGSSGSIADLQQDAASEAAEMAAVEYLTQHVLTSRPQRHYVENVMLSKLTATNKTVEQYRSKVSQYLSSSEFKKRWDALKAQVGGVKCEACSLLAVVHQPAGC